MRSLASSRNALRFLYEESFSLGNADITRLLGEALRFSDRAIAEGQEVSQEPGDGSLYLHFLRAILSLHPEKVRHLVALLKWLEIVPPGREAQGFENQKATRSAKNGGSCQCEGAAGARR